MKTISPGPHLIVAVLMLFPVLVAGCDMAAGAGRDISSAGQAITKTATDNKDY